MAGGIINTGSHPRALWPGVAAWFGDVYAEHEPEYPNLFEVMTSDKNYEIDVQDVTFGLATVKPEGQSINYDSSVQGYESRYVHVVYASGYIVTEEELEDNLYESLSRKRAQSLAISMHQTKENVGAQIYNRAFSGSFVGGDGVSLINTAHPNTSGGTFSNQLTVSSTLSEAAIENLGIQIMQATNDRGLLVALKSTHLLVSPSNFFQAQRIVKSVFQTGTANNDVNVVAAIGMFPKGVHVNHYFSSSTAWFIRTNCTDGMKFYQRRALNFTQDNEFSTTNALAKATERYVPGWSDPRGLFGTPGS